MKPKPLREFRVISQADNESPSRAERGAPSGESLDVVTTVKAVNLTGAVLDACTSAPHTERRIVQVEEICPPVHATRKRILDAVREWSPDVLEPEPVDESSDPDPVHVAHLVEPVADALVCGGIVSDLEVEVIDVPNMLVRVFVHDEAHRYVLMAPPFNLHDVLPHHSDASRTREDRVVDLARVFIARVNELR